MEAGRRANIDARMKGCYNLDNKMTDIYLPRKCDYTDRLITSKDHSSVQLSICDVPLLTLRLTPTAPSTAINPHSSPSPGSCARPVRATWPSKKCSEKRKSSETHLYTHHYLIIQNNNIIIEPSTLSQLSKALPSFTQMHARRACIHLFRISIKLTSSFPAELSRKVPQVSLHTLLGSHHCESELRLVIYLPISCVFR